MKCLPPKLPSRIKWAEQRGRMRILQKSLLSPPPHPPSTENGNVGTAGGKEGDVSAFLACTKEHKVGKWVIKSESQTLYIFLFHWRERKNFSSLKRKSNVKSSPPPLWAVPPPTASGVGTVNAQRNASWAPGSLVVPGGCHVGLQLRS